MVDMKQISEELQVTVDSTVDQMLEDSRFSEEEKDLVARIYKLIGERWSLIAGRIPGRTAEEVEKYWTSEYNNRG